MPKTKNNFTFNPSSDKAPAGGDAKGAPLADITIPAPKPSLDDVLSEWGGTGTIIVGGILSDVDYNPELTGTQRTLIYDQMRKGDATVRAALLAVKLPIISANWYMQEYDQSPEQIKIKEFVNEQLFSTMEMTWNDWLRHCMNYLDYGSMLFEKLFQVEKETGMIGWKKFAPRLTKTIYRWRMPDNVTEGVTQILPTGGLRGIPQWKLLPFVNEQEGENYEGISLLRPAYQPWYFKNSLYRIDAIATERQGLGIPYVKVPPNASDSDRAKIDDILRNLRANEQANIQIPVGWEVGFMDTKGSAIKSAKDMIMHYDRQITKSVLAQFLELGGASAGSFALSTDQSALFILSLKSIATKIQDVLNTNAIRELVDLNFQVEKNQYPLLQVGKIGNTDVEKLSNALFKLSQGGFLRADIEIERYLKNVLDLPEPAEVDEGAKDDYFDKQNEMKITPKPAPQMFPPDNKGSGKDKEPVSASEMNQLENRMTGKLRTISSHIGMDVREMRRNIEDIIHAKR